MTSNFHDSWRKYLFEDVNTNYQLPCYRYCFDGFLARNLISAQIGCIGAMWYSQPICNFLYVCGIPNFNALVTFLTDQWPKISICKSLYMHISVQPLPTNDRTDYQMFTAKSTQDVILIILVYILMGLSLLPFHSYAWRLYKSKMQKLKLSINQLTYLNTHQTDREVIKCLPTFGKIIE